SDMATQARCTRASRGCRSTRRVPFCRAAACDARVSAVIEHEPKPCLLDPCDPTSALIGSQAREVTGVFEVEDSLTIGPRRTCTTVRHTERPVVAGAHLEPMSRRLVEIRNLIVRIVLRAFGQRFVQLPHVPESRD